MSRATRPWPYDDTSGPPAEYVVAPDLIVDRLDRPLLERAFAGLLASDGMKPEWLCPEVPDG